MKRHPANPVVCKAGSTLLAAVITIAVSSMVVAAYYTSLMAKFRSASHAANWHETLHGADAGASYALHLVNQFAAANPDASTYPWVTATAGVTDNWIFQNADGSAVANPKTSAATLNASNRLRVLADAQLPNLGGPENVKVTEVALDVYTRDAKSGNPWFRIRSTARADLPGRYVSANRRDAQLRRMKLGGLNGAASDPHVSRTVEVIVKPKLRFPRAISTVQGLALGNSRNWEVDSFDSSDPNKSDPGTAAGGVYPSSASKRQKNGSIASSKELVGAEYGVLIEGNGATVEGDVSTNGGDDPSTPNVHENVSGSGGMDQNRIYSDFDDDFLPVSKPSWGSTQSQRAADGSFLTGTKANPYRYVVSGNQGSFKVKAPASGDGYVEILINGNLDIGNGNGAYIEIPPNVYATVYVDGNIDFGNGEVNSSSGSSKVATHLTIYGVSTTTNPTYNVSGNPSQYLSFYGPNYAITFSGTAETYGSVVGKSFRINGGGTGGFHYDEALGRLGSVSGWAVASYVEDTRGDVK